MICYKALGISQMAFGLHPTTTGGFKVGGGGGLVVGFVSGAPQNKWFLILLPVLLSRYLYLNKKITLFFIQADLYNSLTPAPATAHDANMR